MSTPGLAVCRKADLCFLSVLLGAMIANLGGSPGVAVAILGVGGLVLLGSIDWLRKGRTEHRPTRRADSTASTL